ncbi:Hypothetical protein, putative, partial [Bodo saltans]
MWLLPAILVLLEPPHFLYFASFFGTLYKGLFQRVTEASKRALLVIQVRPCSCEDMDELVDRCVVAAEERGERFDEATWSSRRPLRSHRGVKSRRRCTTLP